MKETKGKYKPSLVYSSLLKEISKVRLYGKEKYGGTETWLTTNPMDHFDATIRHLRAFMEGEENDKESGLHHLAHAASNIMFEIERTYRKAKEPTPGHAVPPKLSQLQCKGESNEHDNIWRRLQSYI